MKQALMRMAVASLCALAAGSVLAQSNPVLIRHGNTVVTKQDVERVVADTIAPHQRESFFADEKRVREFVSRMFIVRKLAEEGSKRPLSDVEKWRLEELRMRTLSQMQLEHAVTQVKPPNFEALAKETYQARPERFKRPAEVHAAHVLIATKGRSADEARKRAEEALAKLKGGEAFEKVVADYSDDPSAATNKGDLGFFSAGKMVKPFEEAAFALKTPGQLSGLVQSDFGFHIIKLVERRPEGTVPFEEIKDRLVAEEQRQFRNRIVDQETARIAALPGKEVNQEAIAALVKRVPMESGKPAAAAPAPAK
ncbi:MAG: peptidylprolyl isomerase [Burkholderiaceae bacterium]